jgi:hypothetical protein
MTDSLLPERWAAIWMQTIQEHERRSGVPSEQWRVGGRRSKAQPDGEDLEFWQSAGLEQVEKYLSWLENTGWQIATLPDGRPGIEWDAIVHFGGRPVKAVIDAVYESGNDLILVDYKTGTRKQTPQQLGLYASILERSMGVRPKWGGYYMTRHGELSDLMDLSPWSMDYFDYSFGAMNAQLDLGWFTPNPSDHCSWCSFAEYCVAVDGPKSSEYPLRIADNKE